MSPFAIYLLEDWAESCKNAKSRVKRDTVLDVRRRATVDGAVNLISFSTDDPDLSQ